MCREGTRGKRTWASGAGVCGCAAEGGEKERSRPQVIEEQSIPSIAM